MGFIMENPLLWGIVFVVLLIAIIVVISIFVSKNRKKEVEEIEKMFPSGNMSSEDIKISVERVRRSAKERESRKQTKRIHRERPKEAHPDEDKEFVRRGKDTTAKQEDFGAGKGNKAKEEAASVTTQAPKKDKITREPALKDEKEQPSKAKGFSRKPGKMLKSDLLSTSMNRHKIEKGDYKNSRGHSLLQQTMDKQKEEKGEDLAVKQKAHKSKLQSEKTGEEKQAKGDQGTVDKATSRRLFKRSLLKPDKETNTDSGKLPKASLIDSNMYSGQEEKEQNETETEIPSRQKRVNKKSFFSKRK